MTPRYIYKPGETYLMIGLGDTSFSVIDKSGQRLSLPLKELSKFDNATGSLIENFKKDLAKNGYAIENGRLEKIQKTNMEQVRDFKNEGVFYCNNCNQPHPLSEEYHSNKEGWRICERCYAKGLKVDRGGIIPPPNMSVTTFRCFDCGLPTPINGSFHLNEFGARICDDCYKKIHAHKVPVKAPSSSKTKEKLISLSA